MELETESRRITTFITQRGLFQYKRLMFGITSTPEKYQKIVKDMLIGCKGVANIADYLVIHGCGIEEHDENLLAVLRRLRERGLTLHEKCQFRLPKLTFSGHDLNSQVLARFFPSCRTAQNADEKRPTVYVGRCSTEIFPETERSANPSRNTCLLQERMQDTHCC